MIAKLKRLDVSLLLVVLCFMAISTLVIYSATNGTKYEGLHVNNLIAYGCIFVPMLLIAFLDYRIAVRYLSYGLYALGIVLLVIVLLNGTNLNGSTRWISIKSFQFQPSELAKIFLILLVAKRLSNRNGEPLRLLKDILPVLIATFLPVVLILKQPDLGTSIVFVSIMLGMLWMGNMKRTHIAIGVGSIGILVAFIVTLYLTDSSLFQTFVKPHQLARIQTFLDPASDPDKSWHVLNSIRAIGTGDMYGKGFGQGFLVQNGFIPYDYADSIFVVIGEEFGFIGSAVLLFLYFFMIYRMVRIAYDSPDLSGAYIVIGVISMLVLQVFENIAMHLGLMPLTGLALPFVSYGGSSLLTNMIAVGLVLSVQVHHSKRD